MSDQRTVSTDALATLGTIIDDRAKRDAIHLAVIPATAGHRLSPGWRVAFRDGKAYADDQDHDDNVVGIVDPFLVYDVRKGERFWLVLLPRTIQSLRHVWSHPAFPDEPATGSIRGTADVPDEGTNGNMRSVSDDGASDDDTSDEPVAGSVRFADDTSRASTADSWDTDKVRAGILAARRGQSEKWLRAFCARSDCPSYERVLAEAADPSDLWDDEYLHFNGRGAHGEIPPEFWQHVEVVLGRSVENKPKYFSCSC